jgi:ubiquinone/menaquinone biosynthesis C-methylase UbiE
VAAAFAALEKVGGHPWRQAVKNVLAVVLMAGFGAWASGGSAWADQAQKGATAQQGVLEPENANEARLNRLQLPDRTMDAIGIQPGMTVAEIGAGEGRWVVQLAVRVGERGKVIAEDIDKAALAHLADRCARWNLKNVETILGDTNDPRLPAGRLDRIFVISSYHHFDDPVALLGKARAALKPDGKLAIGEWFPSASAGTTGTPPERLKAQMAAAGYVFERMETFLQDNGMYIYLFRPGEKR